MKPIRIVFVCWLMGTSVLASGQLAVRLESDLSEKLTGLPISLRIVVDNMGSTEARLPLILYFHASANGQERFVGSELAPWSKTPIDDEGDQPDWDPRPLLAPGASLSAELPVSPTCEGPSSLLHPFLWPAGRYEVRVLMSPNGEELSNAFNEGATLATARATVPALTVSNPLALVILAPEGVDAEAWNYVLEHTEGRGWRHVTAFTETELTRALRRHYPTSQYTRCFGMAFLQAESLATIEGLAGALGAVAPRPPALDWVELALAGRHEAQCTQRYIGRNKDLEAAIAHCDAARAGYQRVIDTSSSVTIRAKAAESLVRVPTGQEIENRSLRLAAMEAGTYRKVTPLLQCVKESGARLEVRFGYNNPNSFTVYGPPGNFNFFTPGPENRGQPATFLPGLHEGVITVEIEAKRNSPLRAVSWTLDGTTISAPAENVPRCKGK